MKRPTHLRIQIGKGIVISSAIFIAGIVCIIFGIAGMIKQNAAVRPEAITREECVPGKYVSGTVSSVLVKNKNGNVSCLTAKYYKGGRSYNVYTIPLRDNCYIRIFAYSRKAIEQFEAFALGNGEGFHFDGQIKKMSLFSVNWYEGIEEIEKYGLDSIISQFVIMETNPSVNIIQTICGFFFLIIALSVFTNMGGKHEVVSKSTVISYDDDRNISEAVILEYSLRKDFNLIEEKCKLDGLYNKLKEMKTCCCYAYFGLAFGLIVIIDNRYSDSVLYGIAIAAFSIWVIAKYHLNSGKEWAERIMRIFEQESVAAKIVKEQSFIKRLETVVEMEKQEKERKEKERLERERLEQERLAQGIPDENSEENEWDSGIFK